MRRTFLYWTTKPVNTHSTAKHFQTVRKEEAGRPVNVDGTRNYFLWGSYNRQYKFNQNFRVSLRPSFNASHNKSFVSINGVMSEAIYTYPSFTFNVLLNYKDVIELNQRYRLNVNQSFYENKKNFRDVEIVTHNAESEFILRRPKHFVWENLIAYSYNPQVSPGIRKSTVRWNGGVNYVFLKEDKAQIRLSVYDLLNHNVSVFRYTAESSISDVQTTTLRRYYMLSFIYNIRNFSSGAKVGGKERTFGFW